MNQAPDYRTGTAPAPGFWRTLRAWWGSPSSIQRGEPAPLGRADMRLAPEMQFMPPFGAVIRRPSRAYDRGSDSLTWEGGQLAYDPIGAGIVSTGKLNIFPVAVGTYQAGAIFWNTTPTNQAILPTTGPLLTPQQVYALLGNVAGAAAAPNPTLGNRGLP